MYISKCIFLNANYRSVLLKGTADIIFVLVHVIGSRVPIKLQAIAWTSNDHVLCGLYVSLGLSELTSARPMTWYWRTLYSPNF